MPQFRITSPDGTVYEVTAPEGATEQDALERVKAQHPSPERMARRRANSRPETPPEQLHRAFEDDPAYDYGAILPIRTKKDEPIKPASEEGGVVPFLKEHLAAPEMIRAPMRGLADLMGRMYFPGASAAAPGAGSDEAAAVMSLAGLKGAPKTRLTMGTTAPPATAASTARAAGYVLPPAMLDEGAGPVTNALAGLGGKLKLQQAASAKNAAVTDKLAAESLGLPGDTVLTDKVFSDVRAAAGQAYEAVRRSGVPIKQDMQFLNDLLAARKMGAAAAKEFPELMSNSEVKRLQDALGTGKDFSADAGVDLVRQLRADGSRNIKNWQDPMKADLGHVQLKAADAVDALIERNLAAAGKGDLAGAYRRARQTIAKSHDLEAATNTATGEVDARALARLADKGRPLTGGLKLIADTANAFPKAMQSPSRFGGNEPFSALDAFGAGLASLHGRADIVGAILGRPLVRNYLLSSNRQNSLLRNNQLRGLPTSPLRAQPNVLRGLATQGLLAAPGTLRPQPQQ